MVKCQMAAKKRQHDPGGFVTSCIIGMFWFALPPFTADVFIRSCTSLRTIFIRVSFSFKHRKKVLKTTKFPAATLNPKIVTLIAPPLVNAGTQNTAITR